MTRFPFKRSHNRCKATFELIHSDFCGSMQKRSHSGERYFVTFVDDYSRALWTYFMSQKSEVFNLFKNFYPMVKNQFKTTINTVRSDNGGEYCSEKFITSCAEQGIKHQFTTAYSPASNGVAERLNRTLMDKARTLLSDSNLPKCFWSEAINASIWLYNRTYSEFTQCTHFKLLSINSEDIGKI